MGTPGGAVVPQDAHRKSGPEVPDKRLAPLTLYFPSRAEAEIRSQPGRLYTSNIGPTVARSARRTDFRPSPSSVWPTPAKLKRPPFAHRGVLSFQPLWRTATATSKESPPSHVPGAPSMDTPKVNRGVLQARGAIALLGLDDLVRLVDGGGLEHGDVLARPPQEKLVALLEASCLMGGGQIQRTISKTRRKRRSRGPRQVGLF